MTMRLLEILQYKFLEHLEGQKMMFGLRRLHSKVSTASPRIFDVSRGSLEKAGF